MCLRVEAPTAPEPSASQSAEDSPAQSKRWVGGSGITQERPLWGEWTRKASWRGGCTHPAGALAELLLCACHWKCHYVHYHVIHFKNPGRCLLAPIYRQEN